PWARKGSAVYRNRLDLRGLGRFRDRLANVADDGRDQTLIVAFRHDTDDRLGTRRPDDDAARRAQLRLGALDGLAHLIILEGLALGVTNVLENLRQRIEALAHLADRASGGHHGR